MSNDLTREQEAILKAYEDTVKNLYAVFYDTLATLSKKDPDRQLQAEQRFSNGMRRARVVRDMALDLVDNE
jgi:hypothetical protein